MGVLYGKYDLLDRLAAYKVRPAPSDPPGKFETGTGDFEGMCGSYRGAGIYPVSGGDLWGRAYKVPYEDEICVKVSARRITGCLCFGF